MTSVVVGLVADVATHRILAPGFAVFLFLLFSFSELIIFCSLSLGHSAMHYAPLLDIQIALFSVADVRLFFLAPCELHLGLVAMLVVASCDVLYDTIIYTRVFVGILQLNSISFICQGKRLISTGELWIASSVQMATQDQGGKGARSQRHQSSIQYPATGSRPYVVYYSCA